MRPDQERQDLENAVANERRLIADAVGREKKMESQLKVFLSYSKTLYEKELVTRQHHSHRKHQILTQIAADLKSRLEEVEEETTSNQLLDSDRKALESSTAQPAA